MANLTYTVATKIFNDTNSENLERSINDWLKDNNVKVLDIHIGVHPMFDMYQGCQPTICNQWEQYIATIIYNKLP